MDNNQIFEPSSTTTPPPIRHKPFFTKKNLFIGAGIVVGMALIGTATYFLMQRFDSVRPEPATSTFSLEELSTTLQSALSNSANVSVMSSQDNPRSTVIYKISEGRWIVSDTGANMINIYASRKQAEENADDYTRVIAALKNNGFNEMTTINQSTAAYDPAHGDNRYFASDDAVCRLMSGPEIDETMSVPQESMSSFFLSTYCTEMSSFDTTLKNNKPVIDAIPVEAIKSNKDIIFRRAVIRNSGTDNYQNAYIESTSIDMPTETTLYSYLYKTPESDWQYFTSATELDTVACQDYSNTDVRDAFIGTPCWDTETNTSNFVLIPEPEQDMTPDPTGIGG